MLDRENFVKIGGVESYHRQHRHENLAACNREGFNFAKSGSLEVSWNAEKDKKHVTLAISSSKSDCWLASRGKARNWNPSNCENYSITSGSDSHNDGCNDDRHAMSYERFRSNSEARAVKDGD